MEEQDRRYKYGYLVDNTWICKCGALNAAYIGNCGRCEEGKPLIINNI